MNPIRSAPWSWVAIAMLAAILLPACNAVFGLEDRSFGSGGSGGGGTGAGTGEGGAAGATGGTSTTNGPAGGEMCATEDIARSGAFDAGWEGAWTANDLDVSIELAAEQPVLHAIVAGGATEGALINTPATAPACADRCIRTKFSFFASSNFQLYVYLESYADPPGPRIGLVDFIATANDPFDTLDSGPACRLPASFPSVDALVFQALAGGDFLLDDVILDVSECPPDPPLCDEI